MLNRYKNRVKFAKGNKRFSKGIFTRWYKLFVLVIILMIFSTAILASPNARSVINFFPSRVREPDEIKQQQMIKKEMEKYREERQKTVIVVVDAGHGGKDQGAEINGVMEKKLNIDIAKRLGKLLEKQNINVVYTRQEDEFIDLWSRANIANGLSATLFISIHNNIMPDDNSYHGTETLYCDDVPGQQKSMTGKIFAQNIQKQLVYDLGMKDNGIIERPNLAVLKFTSMPAVIVEVGYMSNKADRNKLCSKEFRQKSAQSMCTAIIRTLEDMKAQKINNRWLLP